MATPRQVVLLAAIDGGLFHIDHLREIYYADNRLVNKSSTSLRCQLKRMAVEGLIKYELGAYWLTRKGHEVFSDPSIEREAAFAQEKEIERWRKDDSSKDPSWIDIIAMSKLIAMQAAVDEEDRIQRSYEREALKYRRAFGPRRRR